MTDLRVPPGPGLPEGLVIPESELVERFSRSSGPGGQSVNTTDTRVELVFHGSVSSVLTDDEQVRVGTIRIVASEHRSQHRNRTAARERLADRIRTALTPQAPRVPTKPSKSSRRRRVEAKKRRSHTKALRGRVRD
ncbi:MAG: alternative ribosome rescue aminoacyl-tRNA hydrolase ArfB [Nocardioides sp.]